MKTLLVAAMLIPASCAAEFPNFEAVTIDAHADKVVYAVTIADVNNDKRPDIVALTNRAAYWYAAPDWKKRTIIVDQTEPDNVCVAAHDIDGDGLTDFAVGAGWTKKGTIQWLSRGASLDDKWNVHHIGDELWLHRMRFADVLGTGTPQLVISPLNKGQKRGVRLTAFSIPKSPRTNRWMPTVIDDSLDRVHNHWHLDLDKDGTIDTITASATGIHHIIRNASGWGRSQLGAGATAGKATGAGEIKSGKLAVGKRFLATVEPMHGDQIAVYLEKQETWERHVVVNGLKRGHAVWVANLDDDPDDEIIFGHSDEAPGELRGPGVFVLDASSPDGDSWDRHTIDMGSIATEDAVAADLNGDGRLDIVAGGRSTHNVKLYINRGADESRPGSPGRQ